MNFMGIPISEPVQGNHRMRREQTQLGSIRIAENQPTTMIARREAAFQLKLE
jgi:hypothetical protein